MPIISFANPKGGAGKTTSALLLAGELAGKGSRVVLIDADPERWISQWGRLPGKPDEIEIIVHGEVSEAVPTELVDAERDAAWQRILDAAQRFGVEVSEADWRELGHAIRAGAVAGHHEGAGPALQVVTDNATMLMDSVTVLLHRLGVAYVGVMNPVLRVSRNSDGASIAASSPLSSGPRSSMPIWRLPSR